MRIDRGALCRSGALIGGGEGVTPQGRVALLGSWR